MSTPWDMISNIRLDNSSFTDKINPFERYLYEKYFKELVTVPEYETWSVLIEGWKTREVAQTFVELIEKGIPDSLKTYIGNSKELYLRTTDESPAPDNWWTKYDNIVILVSYLAEIGWTGKEIADAVEKPWHFDTEYQEALKQIEDEAD